MADWTGMTPGAAADLYVAGTLVDVAALEYRLATGVADAVAPSVALVTPAAGTPLGRNTALVVDATDAGGFRRLFVFVKFAHAWELVHDGDGFAPQYSAGSTRTAITNGYRFSVVRTGGWVAAPELVVRGVDTGGNDAN